MAIPVVADADVLFGATTRGLLIHLDYEGVIRLHWSALILDEMSRALVRARRKQDLATAKVHEQRMRELLATRRTSLGLGSFRSSGLCSTVLGSSGFCTAKVAGAPAAPL